MPLSDAAPPLFGVEHSLAGRRWLVREVDERVAAALSQRHALPDVVCRVLASRGVGLAEAESFLNPTLRDLLPDPSHLQDMDRAAERLAEAIKTTERIAIFGDYDVDGATSSALLSRFLRAVGQEPLLYVPDRMTEGYGPNGPALQGLAAQGAKVVVTVDCGTTAFAALAIGQAAGLDVIVVDHHEAESQLPSAYAVVNPKRLDQRTDQRGLAAVGVVFLLLIAVNRVLRESGWYTEQHLAEPRLMDWLDIVALGTVADVVPLTGLNRALVTQGLRVLAKRGNEGLTALLDVAGVKERPDAYHLGYVLGPRVNAGGRVGQADLGARLLTTRDGAEAGVMALRLDEYNRDRQGIEAAVLFEAIEQAESVASDGLPLLLVAGEGWHPGVIGIVASRLKDRYAMPTCVVALDGGLAKGSGRSIPGLDLGRAVIAAREAGLLETGGGHSMAAGFTLKPSRLADLRQFLAEVLGQQLASGGMVPTMMVDAAVDVRGATAELLDSLAMVGPFGAGNEEPHFVIPNVRVAKADVVGQGHVRCILTGPAGGRLKAIAFKSVDSELGVALLSSYGGLFHVAGTLRLDTWQGNRDCQLTIEDAVKIV